MTLIEFKDIDRKPLKGRVQDPGTTDTPALRVHDVAALTKKLKAAGVPVVTTGGEPVDVGPRLKIAIVRDPNNLMLEFVTGACEAATVERKLSHRQCSSSTETPRRLHRNNR